MILKTVQLGHHQVVALVLGHLDLPLPGCASGPGVDVDIDLVAGVGGRHPHVLPGVVATDGGRHGAPGVADSQGVCGAVTQRGPHKPCVWLIGCCYRCIGGGGSQHHRVKIYPQLADIGVGLAECVGAGVRVRAGGVGADDGVGVVGTRSVSTSDGEHTAHPKGGGAGPGG